MNFFQHFFYGVERAEDVDVPLPLKIALMALWIGVMVLIVVYRRQLAAQKNPGLIAKIVALFLLADQVVLYLWQFLSGYFNVELSLPLYHCRICVWLLILDLVFGMKALRTIWIYWAIIGSFFSMAIMDLYKFDFPHYTNFQFFYVHITLGWIVFYAIYALGYRFDKKGLKTALIATTVYNLGLILFNAACNGTFITTGDMLFDYGYMSYAPGGLKDFTLSFPPFTFNLLMLIGYDLLILLLYLGGRALNRISDRNGLEEKA
ncbi:MAG TPA: TIGR02206 family membrane protein [Bacillota bacterium]|jgi:hypothetical integral membrane protein (TIGR02206 family)|nr:TIGR02206 family membrane protein [Fastidiosipila sp.]HPX93050.1 TIGR02206 family membrane protein [Bacillota bacterium]HQB80877.1 TIGR02206 family membrane protein [Bacillota bacterium]